MVEFRLFPQFWIGRFGKISAASHKQAIFMYSDDWAGQPQLVGNRFDWLKIYLGLRYVNKRGRLFANATDHADQHQAEIKRYKFAKQQPFTLGN